MKITLPDKDKWTQPNMGELSGSLFASWNLDLVSNPGKVKISPQTIVKYTIPSDGANTITPFAFVRSSAAGADYYWALCGRKLYNNGGNGGAWQVDQVVDTPTLNTTESDMISFNNWLLVSGDTVIDKLVSGSAWTTGLNWISGLTSGVPHPLCQSFIQDKFLIGNGNNVAVYDTSASGSLTRLILPAEYKVQWIKSSNSTIFIGADNTKGGQAKVFTWDGYSDNYVGDFKVGSEFVFSGIIKNEVCYCVNGYGQLMAFNGGGFVEVARFPIMNSRKHGWGGATYNPIHRNGMALIDNEIHILLNAGVDNQNATFLENMLSGIWAYTRENGLFHRFSITKSTSSSVQDFGSPELYIAGALYSLPRTSGSFYVGATLFQDADSGTQISTINYLDFTDTSIVKLGYFITPKFYTQEAQENWQKVFILNKPLLSASDFISIKHRANGPDNLGRTMKKYDDLAAQATLTGTWVTTTTFTTTVSGVSLNIGDEIEILSGEGSGLSATITDMSGTATKTITIDTAITNASGNFTFRNEGWTKIGTIQDLLTMNKKFGIVLNATWIQYKIILYGTGNSPELDKLISVSQSQLPAK